MSAFLAFRSAAVAVLRPQRVHRLPQPLAINVYLVRHRRTMPQPIVEEEKPKEIKIRKPKTMAQHPKNADIPHQTVQVIDADQTLHRPERLDRLLNSVNLDTHIVRLVTHKPPIVRILTRLEDKVNQLAQKAEKKADQGAQRIENTTIQLTWLTADGDYDHKISKAREELKKGGTRVDVMFKNKPRVRYPSRPEMEAQMEEVVKELEEDGVEWKPRLIEKGKAMIYFQSKTAKARKALPTPEEIEAKAKEELQRLERLQKRSQGSTW